jgi:hypothetical protein
MMAFGFSFSLTPEFGPEVSYALQFATEGSSTDDRVPRSTIKVSLYALHLGRLYHAAAMAAPASYAPPTHMIQGNEREAATRLGRPDRPDSRDKDRIHNHLARCSLHLRRLSLAVPRLVNQQYPGIDKETSSALVVHLVCGVYDRRQSVRRTWRAGCKSLAWG